MPEQDATIETTKVTLNLDGREITAEKGEMIIAAAERAGTYIPRFCYHPRMEPVGVCRMCLVEVDGPRGATLQPACFIPAGEGMNVITDSDKVKKAQDGVLELLLTNHPLDCPICDKGGECPLQDQTLLHGPGESRFVEEKRHFEKPIPISDLVLLDRERCIQCSRCTRFADEIAGEALIDFVGRGDVVEVATFPGEPFDSYFSGNTVQICPVGALTATPYRFAARPWDLDQVESTCTGCSVGCRVAVQSSGDRLTRLLGIDSDPINHSWLCDKGRFGFEATNGVDAGNDDLAITDQRRRLTEPMIRKNGELTAVSWGEALSEAAVIFKDATSSSPSGLGAIGGAQLTNEGAYAWASLLKGLLGTDSVDAQLGDGLDAQLVLGLPRASIEETASACTVVLLTGDLREELPVLFLRLRSAARSGNTSLIDLGPMTTALSALSRVRLPARPADAPGIAMALAGDSSALTSVVSHPEGRTFSDEDLAEARRLIGETGEGVVFVIGRTSVAESPAFVEAAARTLAARFPQAKFLPALRRGNVHGALDMGLAPGVLPGRAPLSAPSAELSSHWKVLPASKGRSTTEQLLALADGSQKAVLLLGADPIIDVADASLVEAAFSANAKIVAVAGHGSPVLARASVVLPAAVAHERTGTTTSLEGRVTHLGQKVVPPGQAWSDWVIATELGVELGGDLGFGTTEQITDEIAGVAPAYMGLTAARLASAASADGLLAPLTRQGASSVRSVDPVAVPGLAGIPQVGLSSYAGIVHHSEAAAGGGGTQFNLSEVAASTPEIPAPDSYSLRLVADRTLYDLGTMVAASAALAPLRSKAVLRVNAYDLDRLGVSSGSQVQVRSPKATLMLTAVADNNVLRGTVAIAATTSSGTAAASSVVAALVDSAAAVTDLRVESL
jgi:NADH-quinone oxidoreductase subunit G